MRTLQGKGLENCSSSLCLHAHTHTHVHTETFTFDNHHSLHHLTYQLVVSRRCACCYVLLVIDDNLAARERHPSSRRDPQACERLHRPSLRGIAMLL